MAIDYAARGRADVRRRDRAIDDESWITALLQRAPVGTLATVHEGQPFINTNMFAFDEATGAIYMHTARVGRTPANVAADQRVCFSVSEMGRLLPAEVALGFSVEYASVIVFGRAEVIDDPAEARYGLQLLLDKYFGHLRPERDYRPIQEDELARTAVYRITIEEWSGKRKQVAGGHPGAFYYGVPPAGIH